MENGSDNSKFDFPKLEFEEMYHRCIDISCEDFGVMGLASDWKDVILYLKLAESPEMNDSVRCSRVKILGVMREMYRVSLPTFCRLLEEMRYQPRKTEYLWSIFQISLNFAEQKTELTNSELQLRILQKHYDEYIRDSYHN